MKILLVKAALGGGSGKIITWLTDALKKNFPNAEVELLVFYKQPSGQQTEVKCSSLDKTIITNKYKRLLFGSIREFIVLNKEISKRNPDIVINFGCRLYYSLLILKYLRNFKLIVSERLDPYTMLSFGDKIRRSLFKKADKIVCQTKESAIFFKCSNKTVVIPNPILNHQERIWDVRKTDKIIINVGRYDLKQKRQDILLKAFKKVLTKYPDYKLMLVGFGLEKQLLQNIAKEVNSEENVIFQTTDNVVPFLRKARVFAFSSDFEGIPNAVIEAMQVGLPIVSVNTSPGCINLLLENGENGIIVPCKDYKALADGITELLENENLSLNYSIKAYLSLERFKEEQTLTQWQSVINFIMKK